MADIEYLLPTAQIITIRSMQLVDIPSINTMHSRLSTDSLYYRYFTPYKPSLEVLLGQAQLYNSRGTAFVAVLQTPLQEIVGLAYYVSSLEDASVAEPALLVEDRFQGQGLGRVMMDSLVREARAHAVDYFHLKISPTNYRVLRVLEQGGLPFERHYCDGIIEIWQCVSFEDCIPNAGTRELCSSI